MWKRRIGVVGELPHAANYLPEPILTMNPPPGQNTGSTYPSSADPASGSSTADGQQTTTGGRTISTAQNDEMPPGWSMSRQATIASGVAATPHQQGGAPPHVAADAGVEEYRLEDGKDIFLMMDAAENGGRNVVVENNSNTDKSPPPQQQQHQNVHSSLVSEISKGPRDEEEEDPSSKLNHHHGIRKPRASSIPKKPPFYKTPKFLVLAVVLCLVVVGGVVGAIIVAIGGGGDSTSSSGSSSVAEAGDNNTEETTTPAPTPVPTTTTTKTPTAATTKEPTQAPLDDGSAAPTPTITSCEGILPKTVHFVFSDADSSFPVAGGTSKQVTKSVAHHDHDDDGTTNLLLCNVIITAMSNISFSGDFGDDSESFDLLTLPPAPYVTLADTSWSIDDDTRPNNKTGTDDCTPETIVPGLSASKLPIHLAAQQDDLTIKLTVTDQVNTTVCKEEEESSNYVQFSLTVAYVTG